MVQQNRPPPAPPRQNWLEALLGGITERRKGVIERNRPSPTNRSQFYRPPIATPTGRTADIMARPEFQEQWGYNRPGQVPAWQEAQQGLDDLFAPEQTTPSIDPNEPTTPPGGTQTFTDAQGRVMTWNGINQYVQTGYDPESVPEPEMTPFQQAQVARWASQDQPEARGGKTWEQMMAEKEATRRAGQATQSQQRWEAEQSQAQQQFDQMMAWNREQAQGQVAEQERQQMARFAAMGPISWMQSAAYTGEAPTMPAGLMPLMPQQYGAQPGQGVPGWTPQGATEIPELARPSAQLYARMGPTAQQQLKGYRQARTGTTPEEQDFRRRASAPPGGLQGGLRWNR